ncbi:MAG: arsenate reductase (glutaredoxin) [Magnetococcales bacterium]|nr:arsenate reductase (glutaredoxin) [Magnetococcales bacterium]MBF0149036.1 arsenate reductase (glutaredoxin) [Magnetococcales bacterium]MBF0172085.1 arsenate reductase (glutaredoxin) [Magnetococcales bacterium]MBF0346197.1 arsenate reductase (glutaredoxin) [Magnetococcales bacterium]MBF0630310.1 arsenate reductase (glutaredoxin) [Magnetococcales bacterium]
MEITYYHNPRCSKSRSGLDLLRRQGVELNVIEYLVNPPSKQQLLDILDKLRLEPRQLMRQKEPEYKENNLDDPNLSRDALVDALIKFPELMERPVAVTAFKAAIGRPPEHLLALLG